MPPYTSYSLPLLPIASSILGKCTGLKSGSAPMNPSNLEAVQQVFHCSALFQKLQ